MVDGECRFVLVQVETMHTILSTSGVTLKMTPGGHRRRGIFLIPALGVFERSYATC